jgi:bifunctional DNA-binding transcriptional regulator/antitoxin component of YhaV-PrlF toxin-antitoxin module
VYVKANCGVDDAARFTLPQEAIEALGLQPGDEVDIEIVGHAVVVRSVADAARAGEFSKASRASYSVGAAPTTNSRKA